MRTEKRKKKKRWLKITSIIIAVMLVAIGTYAFVVYKSFTSTVDTMHQPINREKSEKRNDEISLTGKEPFSVLILGVDQRKGDRGRSDTMIVMTVNPKQNSTKMLSIPRDTRTEIVGRNTLDKINHAYAFGGEEMSMATVEHLLDIPIDYYVRVNMEGFKDIVNAVGGIQVNNNLDFTNDGQHFATGNITLNGNQALSFVRMRHNDPNGDFGRQDRQRQVIQGIIRKGASVNSLTNYGDIFDALGKNVRTNLTFKEMLAIQDNYKAAAGTIDQMKLSGKGTKINGIYYLQIPESEIQNAQNELKQHLEVK